MEIIIIIALAAWAFFALRSIKKNGAGCGGNCANCASACKNKDKKKDE